MSERLITSLTNDTVKAVRALHMRKERDQSGRFLAEGLKFIGEALDQGRAPRLLLVGQDARAHPLLDRARAETLKAGGEVVAVTHPILAKISRKENPQTVLGVFDQAYTDLDAIDPATAPAWVALEQVRDPGNLGTIIRTADAAGAGGVIGTRLDATHGYRDAPVRAPVLILMGNEQAGLTDRLAAACDLNVKIPMRGRADSLNLAIATGVMLYAVTEQA